MRFDLQAGGASNIKYIFNKCVFFLFVTTDHFFAPRRVEAWRELFWVPLGSCYYYCIGWVGYLYCVFLEDRVGGELYPACVILYLLDSD